MRQEDWRVVPGYQGRYWVSNLGRVARTYIKGEPLILKPVKLYGRGYPAVSLWLNGAHKFITIHKLVTLLFLGPRPKGSEVNHIDGDKQNPSLHNLEYVTPSENLKHAYATGLNTGGRGVRTRRASSRLETLEAAVKDYLAGKGSLAQVGAHYKISRQVVWHGVKRSRLGKWYTRTTQPPC